MYFLTNCKNYLSNCLQSSIQNSQYLLNLEVMTEITEDIVPAVKLAAVLPKEISAEDFQKQLFSWFQDKGLMAELRSHLRVKMIGILKNASLDYKVRNSFSPKLQAVNLLIAEYLLYKEYHYSLSVFSTEVPLTNEFQDYSLHDGRVKKYQFSESDMWDILEILGITNDSDEGKDVHGNYYKVDNKEPLLTCIIRTLHNMNQKSCAVIAEVNTNAINVIDDIVELNTDNKDHLLLKSITNLLIQAKVTPKYIADITEQFSQIIRTEIDRISEQKQKECLHIKQKIRQDSKQRIEKCKQKVFVIEKAFALERNRLHFELEKSKADIQECALQLQTRTDNLNEKERMLSTKELDLVVQEDAIVKKDKLLTTKDNNLTEREDRLHTELQALYIEKLKLNEMKQRLRRISPHKSDKFCLNQQSVKSLVAEPTALNTINKEQQTIVVHNIENVLLKQTIRQLHLENESLRDQMKFQNTRINDLNQQTNNLTIEIVDLRKCLSANTISHHTSKPQFKKFPTPPTNLINYVQALAYNACGDKEIREHLNSYTNNQDQNYAEINNGKCSSRPLSPMDSSLGESPTDNILKAAKVRLMTLEKESREIERNFERYKSKPMTDLYSNHIVSLPNNKSKLTLVEKLNSNIAIVRENISKLIFDTDYVDTDALLNEKVERITTCTATPCAVEFRGNFSYNSLIADIPGSEYDVQPEDDGFPMQGTLSTNGFSTEMSDTDHEQKVKDIKNIPAI